MRNLLVRDAGRLMYFDIADCVLEFTNMLYDKERDKYVFDIMIIKIQGTKDDETKNMFRFSIVVADTPEEANDLFYKVIREIESCSPNGEVTITTSGYKAWEQSLWHNAFYNGTLKQIKHDD